MTPPRTSTVTIPRPFAGCAASIGRSTPPSTRWTWNESPSTASLPTAGAAQLYQRFQRLHQALRQQLIVRGHHRGGTHPLLLRALALSGGFAPYADINQIVVYRSGTGKAREQFTYDLDKVRAGQEMDPDIRPDDVIVVQRNARRAALRDSLFGDILNTLNPFR